MNAKIEALKQAAAEATAAHDAERDRLAALGLKSGERYLLLKPLKAAADAAHAEYVKAAHGAIKGELNKIIRADAPARAAAARARSPWKQAKFDARNAG
jgi:hypothetical protein